MNTLPNPYDAEFVPVYSIVYKHQTVLHGEILKKVIDNLVEKENLPKNILDVGSGTGLIAAAFAKDDYNVLGIDISQPMVDFANKHFNMPNLAFECKDIIKQKEPLPKVPFIYAVGNIVHYIQYENLPLFFNAIHDTLIPGGYFFFDLTTPLGFKEWEIISISDREDGHVVNYGILVPPFEAYMVVKCTYQNHGITHQVRRTIQNYTYTPQDMEAFITQTKFDESEVPKSGIDSPTNPKKIMYTLKKSVDLK